MKLHHLKKFLGLLIVAICLVSFPMNPPTAVAAPFGVDLQISKDMELWSNSPITVPEGTRLFYRAIGTAFTTTVAITNISTTLPSYLDGDFITYTLTPGKPSVLGLWGQRGSPILALLGTYTEFITVTGIASPPSTVVAWATYTGVSSAVPEPATLLLIGSGLLGLAGLRRKLKK